MTKMYSYALHGLIAACIIVTGMIAFKHQLPPRIVKIDLLAITSHYTALMLKETTSNATSSLSKKISETIKINLEPIINDYAKTHNVIVIQSQAVISNNVVDMTNQIIEQLDKKLK